MRKIPTGVERPAATAGRSVLFRAKAEGSFPHGLLDLRDDLVKGVVDAQGGAAGEGIGQIQIVDDDQTVVLCGRNALQGRVLVQELSGLRARSVEHMYALESCFDLVCHLLPE